MSESAHIEYSSETELLNEFKKCMRDPQNLETATNYLYNSLLDEAIAGVVFEVHYATKTGLSRAMEGKPEDNEPYSLVDVPDYDVFGANIAKIAMDCTCPICDRTVAASRFAPHLEKCMGMFLWPHFYYVNQIMFI